MKKQIVFFLVLSFLLIYGCKKEYSFETSDVPSVGTLQSNVTGDCFPKSVTGIFESGKLLVADSNYILLEINVTTIGSYTINTDTVNGYYFRATGVFTTTGTNVVKIRSFGTPGNVGINNFVVQYGVQVCTVAVTVLPAGASGPAVFSLVGSPAVCTGAVPNGVYAATVPLSPTSNIVTLNLNVTTIGTYNISTTPFNGIRFSGTGNFTITGTQNVILTGSGTPLSGGSTPIIVTAGSSVCTFLVNVVSAAVFTFAGSPVCSNPVVSGTYTVGVVVSSAHTVRLDVNVTTAGAYSVSSSFTGGMQFDGSGTLATGPQTILLVASGTPTTAGANTLSITFGSSTCTFTVNVSGGTSGAGTLSGGPSPAACAPFTVNGTYTALTALTAGNTVQVQVNITTPGTVSIATNTVTGFSFSFSGNLSTGTQMITLVGTGTPATSGVKTFTTTFGTSSSTCTFPVTVAAALSNDYYPRTTNSNWSYEKNDNVNDSLYRNVIAATITATGNSFNIFMQNDGVTPPPDSSGYYRKNGGDYFEWFDAGTWIGYDNPLWAEYIMLKDNVALNFNWKSSAFNGTITANPISIRFSYTIQQKDVPISFATSTGTMNLNNVIVVEERLEAFDGANWMDITASINYYGKSYYARGIGLVKFETYNAANAITAKQELRRYQVF